MENRKSRLTKRLLRESMIELLGQKELSRITIKDVAENADLNRSTFYSHYQDVYELLDEITQDMLGHVPFATIQKYSISDISDCLKYIYAHKEIYSVLLEKGIFHQFLLKKSIDIFLDGSLLNGAMTHCDPEYYHALSCYCTAGSESFLSYCLKSSIPIDKQAEILYHLAEQARKLALQYS